MVMVTTVIRNERKRKDHGTATVTYIKRKINCRRIVKDYLLSSEFVHQLNLANLKCKGEIFK